jgi:hypothetical protein
MEMTSDIKIIKNTKPSQYQYISPRQGERLRWIGVMKELCFKFFNKLWSIESKRVSARSIDTKFMCMERLFQRAGAV